MLTRWRNRGETGSGMTIGVAILFPMLVIIVMVLQHVADSSRIEQSLQATANRAARAASLCCYSTGGSDGAHAVVEASLRAAERDNAYNRVFCNNDLVADSTVVFEYLDGRTVSYPDANVRYPDANGNYPAVPPAGMVHVYLECSVPPQLLGNFALPVFDTKRTVVGTATIDPYRFRSGA